MIIYLRRLSAFLSVSTSSAVLSLFSHVLLFVERQLFWSFLGPINLVIIIFYIMYALLKFWSPLKLVAEKCSLMKFGLQQF